MKNQEDSIAAQHFTPLKRFTFVMKGRERVATVALGPPPHTVTLFQGPATDKTSALAPCMDQKQTC